jgi:hypothetical protein
VFKNDKLILNPLGGFCQVRPSFEHVNKERAQRQIKTKEQINAERAEASKVTRVIRG